MGAEKDTFAEVNNSLAEAAKNAEAHCEAMSAIIGELAAFDDADRSGEALLVQLRAALQQLREELSRPLVRIAAIGTTSSAKSSLLNFLCGLPLLPTGVQEKSAGSVRIINSPDIALEIEETEGALWQCGDVEVSKPEEITEALDTIMGLYREAVNRGEEPDAPGATVRYPVRLAGILQLPPDFQLELMDLPGLKFTGDERNLRIIRQCADALCLVTLGSQETDPVRQDALVEEALEQVRTIGSPIARMLFVITRVDEFLLREPENWPENEDAYVVDRSEAILAKLNEQMPDRHISAIANSRVSPMPALYSLDLEVPEKRVNAYRKVRRNYNGLLLGGHARNRDLGVDPDFDLSSSKCNLWEEEDWAKVAEQLQETSGALDFLATLRQHIAANLLAITLPPVLSRYAAVADETSREIRDWVNLLKVRVTQDFEGQRELLARTGHELANINEKATLRLQEFLIRCNSQIFDKVAEADQQGDWLRETMSAFPEFAVPRLSVLAQWPKYLQDAYLLPIRCMRERITQGKPLPVNLPQRTEMERAIQRLMRVGYDRQAATSGKTFVTTARDRKDELESAFRWSQKVCNKSIQACLANEFALQTDNVLLALEQVQDAYLAKIDGMMSNVPEEFTHVVQITPDALKKFAQGSTVDAIDPGVPLRTSVRKFKESKVFQNLADGGVWLVDKITNLYRRITGNDTITVEYDKTEYNIELPSMESFQREMASRFGRYFEVLQKQMAAVAQGQVQQFLDNIRKCQESRIAAYENKLAEVMRAKSLDVASRQVDLNDILARLESGNRSLLQWQYSLENKS